MFEPSKTPRVFGLPPGVDFSRALLDGVFQRLSGTAPHAITSVQIYVNTRRTERRLSGLLDGMSPGFLPRIKVVSDIAHTPIPGLGSVPVVSSLRRRLELAQTVTALLDAEPDLAPRTAAFDLANSLADLMDEMQSEGVSPDVFRSLDVTAEHALHWQKSRSFLEILAPYFHDTSQLDTEARQRRAIIALVAHWAENPPNHPILVAGSTGSRGPTAMLMKAVAALPQGAVVLPGFDFEFPSELAEAGLGEDHPQARLVEFVRTFDLRPDQIERWTTQEPPSNERNALINLALRPAPVTDQWLSEGPKLRNLDAATSGLTLIEARDQRQEALAIALCLRKAAEDGQTATLISPDRRLTRQVTALLERWRIEPDDSAGRPLHLTPPGIFLGLIARTLAEPLTTERLLEILKHPLCNAASDQRGQHLGHVRALEQEQIRGKSPFVDFAPFVEWAGREEQPADRAGWVDWLCVLGQEPPKGRLNLEVWLELHQSRAEALVDGPDAKATNRLWSRDEGEAAAKVFAELNAHADASVPLSGSEYVALIRAVLNREEVVRRAETPYPGITIWGTIEARVGGADLVVLGGLNDGTWPGLPPPDPWLNRQMRQASGLLSPERRIGLSAHDFQQAIAGKSVILCRSLRDADAPTVPSRWITRLTNLMAGLPENGVPALENMRSRGKEWLRLADQIEQPATRVDPAPRPAPRPPATARPARLSVTQIRTLILDPYEIYARHILGLKALEPIRVQPDAMLRGQALHKVLENFIRATMEGAPLTAENLKAVANAVFAEQVPWPATRQMWAAQVARIADDFVRTEPDRQQAARPELLEKKGRIPIGDTGVDLTGIADRIDRAEDDRLVIYDYKSGALPTNAAITNFDKQLALLAHMAANGAFGLSDAEIVAAASYIGLKAPLKVQPVDTNAAEISETWSGLVTLIARYNLADTGFPALYRHLERPKWGDYLHLSRLGEWSLAHPPVPKDVG